MFRIDKSYFNAELVANGGLVQTADILDGENSGRTQNTGRMYLDYLGTFFNHKIQLRRGVNCTDAEWNQLFLKLADPIHEHNIDVPFGAGILTLDMYVSQVQRTLVEVKFGNINVWERVIEFTATAMESNWLAGGSLQGYREA